MAQAAGLLGWKVKMINVGLSPQAVVSAWQQILQAPPDLLAYGEIVPDAVVSKQISEAASKKIPIVELAPEQVTDSASPTGPVYAQVSGTPDFAESGRLMGDAVVADAGIGAKTVWITDPTLAIFKPAEAAFAAVVKAAGGSVDVLNVSENQIGQEIPSQVVSYVQSHPDVKYLAFSLNDFTAGVPEALKAANLENQVKIVSRAPSAANIRDIQTGAQWLTVVEETAAAGWRSVDQLARVVMGVPISHELANPVGWHQIIDKSNVGTKPVVPQTPGTPRGVLQSMAPGIGWLNRRSKPRAVAGPACETRRAAHRSIMTTLPPDCRTRIRGGADTCLTTPRQACTSSARCRSEAPTRSSGPSSRHLGHHLSRIPDGETGNRQLWVQFQLGVLGSRPEFELVQNEMPGFEDVPPTLRLRAGRVAGRGRVPGPGLRGGRTEFV